MDCCSMKGYLSYIILWILSRKEMTGAEISKELERRRGSRPSPGTIYPALKELKEKGLISDSGGKTYALTEKGSRELNSACAMFCRMFYDMKDMLHCGR